MADRRAQLAEAFSKVEEDEKDSAATGDSGEVDESKEEVQDSPGADEQPESDVGSDKDSPETSNTKTKESGEKTDSGVGGKSVQKATGKSAPESTSVKSGKPSAEDAAKALEKAEKEAAEAGDAPKAWRPTEREAWRKIPKEAREAINRRETEITQFIGQHGAAIQHKKQFDEVVQPFLPFIAARQSTPMKAFHGLMTTAARLTTGSPVQKAQVISEIMDNYGVDVKSLDEFLTGKIKGTGVSPGAGHRNDNAPPPWAQPLFNFMSEAQKDRQTREQKIKDAAAAELAEFEKKPFFSDLEPDIGLLMQHAAAQGRHMTMQQAYDKARKMNPEVDKILTQRERAAAAKVAQMNGNSVDKARAAASAVKGSPGAGTNLNGVSRKDDTPKSRREILAAAIDAQKED